MGYFKKNCVLKSIGCTVLLMVLAGCATIFKGEHADVDVSSTPSNVDVYIKNNHRGTTPATLSLERDEDHMITFKKDGYKDVTIEVEKDFDAVTTIVGNIFSWGLLGVAVDFGTGAAYSLEPAQLRANLEELKRADIIDVNKMKKSSGDIHVVMLTMDQWQKIKAQ